MIVTGIVQEGARRGAQLGFPTANIPAHDPEMSGIYAGRVTVSEHSYDAVLYADKARGLLEAHLLDFAGDLYGEMISVEIGEKLRERADFVDDATLRAAIASDIAQVRAKMSDKTSGIH